MNIVQIAKDIDPSFDDFRALYPRKIAMKDAQKAWQKIDREKYPLILERLYHWRKVWMARGEPEFVPYPATWLRGERWEDELPAIQQQMTAPLHASQVPASLPETKRTEMPQYVRDLILKLKK